MNFLLILMVLLTIESSNRPNPPAGDGGRAVGVLQIWPIMVDECNRIAGEKRWTYVDRHSKVQSVQMCAVYMNHQVKRYRAKYGRDPDAHALCESWQSGSIFRRADKRYQLKVWQTLQRIGK